MLHRERRIGRPVDRRLPDLERVLRQPGPGPVHRQERRSSPGGRRSHPVRVRWKHPRKIWSDRVHVLVDDACRLAAKDTIALVSPDADAGERRAPCELGRRHHIRVLGRPHAELRIVHELRRVAQELVRAPSGCRVARPRDGHALVVRAVDEALVRRLAGEPAARELVVQDNRVATVPRPANGRAREERAPRSRPVHHRALLVVDGEGEVDPLHVVVRANVAGRIRPERPVDVRETLEVLDRCRHAPARVPLDRAISAACRSECQGLVLLYLRAELLSPPRLNVTKGPNHVRPRDPRARAPGLDESYSPCLANRSGAVGPTHTKCMRPVRSTESPNLGSRRLR